MKRDKLQEHMPSYFTAHLTVKALKKDPVLIHECILDYETKGNMKNHFINEFKT